MEDLQSTCQAPIAQRDRAHRRYRARRVAAPRQSRPAGDVDRRRSAPTLTTNNHLRVGATRTSDRSPTPEHACSDEQSRRTDHAGVVDGVHDHRRQQAAACVHRPAPRRRRGRTPGAMESAGCMMANTAALASAAGQTPKLRRRPPKISPRKMNSSKSGAAMTASGNDPQAERRVATAERARRLRAVRAQPMPNR